MRVVSLFSGAGGLDLGFKKAGCTIVWANDIEPRFTETYKKNIGNHVVTKDLKKVNVEEIPDCDIIIGGYPCLGFTIAKVDRTVDDEQNFLYLEYLRILKAKKPKYFLVENVLGMQEGEEFKKHFNKMLSDFRSVGYKINVNRLKAVECGVPQKRERLIIIGVRSELNTVIAPPISTHLEQSVIMFDNSRMSKWITLKDAIGDLPEDADNSDIQNHKGTKHKVLINGYVGHRALDWNKPSPTITGRGSLGGGPVIHPHPNQKRRLTVRECARLQSFPDDFIFEGSISVQYAQIGNAVPPLLAFRVAQQIMKAAGETPRAFNPEEWKLPYANKIPKN